MTVKSTLNFRSSRLSGVQVNLRDEREHTTIGRRGKLI